MSEENYVELQKEDGTTIQCSVYDIVHFESKDYALLTMKDNEGEVIVMRLEDDGENCSLSTIDNEDEFKRVCDYIQGHHDKELSETELYKVLNTDEYKERPYEYSDLGEGMAVIGETMWGWSKHRFLINHNTKRAYEFMDKGQKLVTVTEDDIDWESLKGLPEDAVATARALSFHFPSFIRHFENGVAEVSWQLNPDGRYYMDEDGYGMTDDEEIEIYGLIDQNAKVIVKFKNINECYGELDKMRKEAEEIVKQQK